MSLTAPDQQWVRDIVKIAVQEAAEQVLAQHIASCPHGQRLDVTRAKAIGVLLGIAGVGTIVGSIVGAISGIVTAMATMKGG